MYIQRNKSKNSKTGKECSSVLLCSKYREGNKVNPRTVANLSHLSDIIALGIKTYSNRQFISSNLLVYCYIEK